ncbi:MAG: type II secretion system protein [Candidatus Paceibacterota bacterium]|jgi:prepilin-type N-terminal cleavage/methylation domain-containing protein
MQTQKGFTLIELLVVIAIIGILAGMVVVNMSSAPDAAKNAKLQSYFDQLRTVATVYKTTTSTPTYIGFDSTTGSEGLTLKTKIGEISGGTVAPYYYSSSTADNFCAKGRYTGSASTTYWCIDSTNGFSGATTSATACSTTLVCN